MLQEEDRRESSKRPQLLAAGLVDAGCAALATFAINFFAVRSFDASTLGVYSVFVTSLFFGATVAYQLTFVPAEVATLALGGRSRLWVVAQSLRIGGVTCVVIGALVPAIAMLLVRSVAEPKVAMAFALTAAAACAVSPIQDHLRRMLHQAKISWIASAMSVTQLAVVLGCLALLSSSGVPAQWIPLSALAAANVVSGLLGWASARRLRGAPVVLTLKHRQLWWSGRWLAFAGAMQNGAGFLVAAMVVRLAGAEAMGYAESARLVAQPLLVLAFGITAVLGPPSMEAGARRELGRGRRLGRTYIGIVVPISVCYLALVGVSWAGNPLIDLLPTAYTVGGLVLVSGLANMLLGTAQPMNAQLLGGRQEVTLARVEGAGNLVRLAVGATAGIFGPMVVPVGVVAFGLTRWACYPHALRSLYRTPAPAARSTHEGPPLGGI